MTGTPGPGPRRPDAFGSPVTQVAAAPLDPDYAEAAARRAHPHAGSGRSSATPAVVVVVAAVLGLGTVWAAKELRQPEPEVLRARAALESEIERRTESARELQDDNARVGAEVEALSQEALAGTGEDLERLAALGAVAGTVAVEGPGLSVTLTDSARAAAGAADAADERVQDIDLQILSNGLWAAGAEAIAVNGHRLTALSAIRSAGEAILVDLTPLVGPYRVDAVGDPEAMQADLARSAAARHLALLRETYQIGAQIAVEENLVLPASPVPTLEFATVPTPGVAEPGTDVPGSGTEQGGTA